MLQLGDPYFKRDTESEDIRLRQSRQTRKEICYSGLFETHPARHPLLTNSFQGQVIKEELLHSLRYCPGRGGAHGQRLRRPQAQMT